MRDITPLIVIIPLLLGRECANADFQEYNLLDAVALPNDGVTFITDDTDNFPVLNIQKEADIKTPFRLILPERLTDFLIRGIIRPESLSGGYIFSVVNPLETVVQLGVHLSPVLNEFMNITLYYSDSSYDSSRELNTFEIPYTKEYFNFAFKVLHDTVVFYLDCDEFNTVKIKRQSNVLTFDSASTLYVGQAGPKLRGNFEGSFQFLKIYANPNSHIMNACIKPDFKKKGDHGFSSVSISGPIDPFAPTDTESGLKGEKGDRGLRGPPGDSIRGPPGPPGPPGLQGTSFNITNNEELYTTIRQVAENVFMMTKPKETCACNITSAVNILKNDIIFQELIRGPPGMPGREGRPGPMGDKGMPGPQGARGAVGAKGSRGEAGEQGRKGEPGVDGAPGLKGPPGPAGPPGFPENYESLIVNTMQNLNNNLMGIKGYAGEKGETGPPGDKGMKGDKGDDGSRGLPGDKGSQGVEGPAGAKGETGSLGKTGAVGPPGAKGDRGDPGPPGGVIYGDDVGSSQCQCSSEKGDKGDFGEPGMKGEKGADGSSMFAPDFSMYNITKGDKGERGQRGRRGKPGPAGVMGPPGRPGELGDTGDPGWPGLKGDPGEKGDKGDTTVIEAVGGEKGDKGAKGEPGPPGVISMEGGQINQITSFDGENQMGVSVVQNVEELRKLNSTIGTIVFLVAEEALLLRVTRGWQYISLGTYLPLTSSQSPISHYVPPPASNRPDSQGLQASNLLHNNLEPVVGPSNLMLNTIQRGKKLRMAALNEPYSGDLKGMRGADFDCYRQARRAGLVGTFRAFISERIQNIDSIVQEADHKLPVVNIRGEVLFNSWKEIFNGQGGFFAQTPRIYSFNGKNILTDTTWPQKAVWHGSDVRGERAMETYCEAWHSAASTSFGLASTLLSNKLLNQERISCDNKLAVLCIEALSHND
ncbi:collagen alpha-1(XV) chain isoform X2 [Phlebotomus argentipes]|uniref:collagen alpha-1(XV) chain isoform X2 n=1 Tax=Phlebotomus argentipes TaxID=94469 RepID=UPI0028929BF4|nr:collagen alpha-1(XV) chain isoform X2 [Phlebotomus argentipes]